MTSGAEDWRVAAAVVFPGQGAQAPGLGEPWRDQPEWELVERAERLTTLPLARLLLDAPAEDLARTREAQLAVLLASLLAWEAARPALADRIVAFAGHSLGQITALIAAGAVSFDDGIRLAARRAEVTQACADAGDHAMAALLGATTAQAEAACEGTECWVANDNGGGQVVVAGSRDGVAAAGDRARAAGVKRVVPLNVGGAFHTPLMLPAADGLDGILAEVRFRPTPVPVVCNTDGAPVTDPASWAHRLRSHLVRPVRWSAVLEQLRQLGATTLVEIGPGTTLTSIAKRQVGDVELRHAGTPSEVRELAGVEVAP